MSVRNGIEAISMRSKIAGDNASRNGLSPRRWVVRVRVDDATWSVSGRCTSRRAVMIDSMRGINEKRRSLRRKWLATHGLIKMKPENPSQVDRALDKLGFIMVCTHPTVSPHVGSVSPSHMKLPTKAQMAEMNSVTGTKKEVAIITGRTKTRRR